MLSLFVLLPKFVHIMILRSTWRFWQLHLVITSLCLSYLVNLLYIPQNLVILNYSIKNFFNYELMCTLKITRIRLWKLKKMVYLLSSPFMTIWPPIRVNVRDFWLCRYESEDTIENCFFGLRTGQECIITIDKLMRRGYIMVHGCYLCKGRLNHTTIFFCGVRWPTAYGIWCIIY